MEPLLQDSLVLGSLFGASWPDKDFVMELTATGHWVICVWHRHIIRQESACFHLYKAVNERCHPARILHCMLCCDLSEALFPFLAMSCDLCVNGT